LSESDSGWAANPSVECNPLGEFHPGNSNSCDNYLPDLSAAYNSDVISTCNTNTTLCTVFNSRLLPNDIHADVEYNNATDTITIENPSDEFTYVFFRPDDVALYTVNCPFGSCEFYMGFMAMEFCPEDGSGICEQMMSDGTLEPNDGGEGYLVVSSFYQNLTTPVNNYSEYYTFEDAGESATLVHFTWTKPSPNDLFRLTTVNATGSIRERAFYSYDSDETTDYFYPFVALLQNSGPVEITEAIQRENPGDLICPPGSELNVEENLCYNYNECEIDEPCGDGETCTYDKGSYTCE